MAMALLYLPRATRNQEVHQFCSLNFNFCIRLNLGKYIIGILMIISVPLFSWFCLSFFFLFCVIVAYFSQRKTAEDYPWEVYTLKELLHATNNFNDDNKIGEGGFGSVYWGRTSKGVEAIMSIYFFLKL